MLITGLESRSRTFIWCLKLICWFGDAAWVCGDWVLFPNLFFPPVVLMTLWCWCCPCCNLFPWVRGTHSTCVWAAYPCGVLLLSVYTHITLSPELLKSHGMGLLMREDKNSETRGCDLPSSIFTKCYKYRQAVDSHKPANYGLISVDFCVSSSPIYMSKNRLVCILTMCSLFVVVVVFFLSKTHSFTLVAPWFGLELQWRMELSIEQHSNFFVLLLFQHQ